jgi:hypothetical protein
MTTRGIGPVPDNLGNEALWDFLNQLRKANIDVLAGRVAALGTTTTITGTGTGTAGPPGPPGPPSVYVPDLTPPPTVSGVSVSAGLDFVFITTDAPVFTQGNGYNRTLVYGVTYTGDGITPPLPTFGDAVLVHEFVGQVGSFATPPGTQWHIWVKWRTNDGVLSVSPEGGANGHQVTTALIGNSNLGPLIIEAGNLANGAVTTAKFAAGIEPVSIVAVLPTALGYTGPKMVLLTTDGKLYRYVAGAWTTAVPTVDLVGTITTTQITPGAITTPLLAAGAVTAATIAANTITASNIAANAITSNAIAANAVVAGKIAAGAISATEIAAGQIQATHLAANSIAVGTAAIQNGAIVNAMIGDATIVSLSASKILAGSIAVGEYIQSADFSSGVSGWRFGGNTAELGSASIRGTLTASQLSITTLSSITANLGAVTAGTISGVAINGATITGGVLQTAATGSKRVVINESGSNEIRVYGNSGEQLASIGINVNGADTIVGLFGNASSSYMGLWGVSGSDSGVFGSSTSGEGVYGVSINGIATQGISTNNDGVYGVSGGGSTKAGVRGSCANGNGVFGVSTYVSGVEGTSSFGSGVKGWSSSGYGGEFNGNATKSALFLGLVNNTAMPSGCTAGALAMVQFPAIGPNNVRLCFIDQFGVWRYVENSNAIPLT